MIYEVLDGWRIIKMDKKFGKNVLENEIFKREWRKKKNKFEGKNLRLRSIKLKVEKYLEICWLFREIVLG